MMRQFKFPSATAIAVILAFGGLSCGDNSGSSNGSKNGGDVTNNPSGPDYEEEGGIGHVTPADGAAGSTDILWVIDNSGSMCEEQAALRENFDAFVEELDQENVDFHIGVTTTHMEENSSTEQVARPGRLQSMPQPVVVFPTCMGDAGAPDDDSDGYRPIRANLEMVVDNCTKDPARWESLKDISDDDIACHLDHSCGEYWEIFPTTPSGEQPTPEHSNEESPYRRIPRVLKAEMYRNADGTLNREQLERDFGCMSLVGTSGYGIEKGLAAAIKAVSPEMTGGAVEAPEDDSAPNHGFLRKDANFAVVFVSDDNDCTHDGTLAEETICGDDICAFANNPAVQDSPLIEPSQLADDLRNNLSASKGRQVGDGSLTAASIHGRWFRYGEDYPAPADGEPQSYEECSDMTQPPDEALEERASCSSAFAGMAKSGDRYERFLRSFSRTYPEKPAGDDEHMRGLVCELSGFGETLKGIGETVSAPATFCLTRPLYACEEGSSAGCPPFRYGDTQPTCLTDGAGDSVCESAVDVELLARQGATDPRADLESTGYCIADSIEVEDGKTRCVVERSRYRWVGCEGGLSFEWESEAFFDEVTGVDVRLRYVTEDWEPAAEQPF